MDKQEVRIVAEGVRGTTPFYLGDDMRLYFYAKYDAPSYVMPMPKNYHKLSIRDFALVEERPQILEEIIPRDYRSFLGGFDPSHPYTKLLEQQALLQSNKEKKLNIIARGRHEGKKYFLGKNLQIYTAAEDVQGCASAFSNPKFYNNISYFHKVDNPNPIEIYENMVHHFYKQYSKQKNTIERLISRFNTSNTSNGILTFNEAPINLDNGHRVHVIAMLNVEDQEIYLSSTCEIHQGKEVEEYSRTNISKRDEYPLTTTTTLDERLAPHTADIFADFRAQVDKRTSRILDTRAYDFLQTG